jgi:hypothetical protein
MVFEIIPFKGPKLNTIHYWLKQRQFSSKDKNILKESELKHIVLIFLQQRHTELRNLHSV